MKFLHSLFSILLCVTLFSTSCKKDCDCPNDNPSVNEYPSLRLINQNTNEAVVGSVSLVGYEFDDLNIEIGESQTFILDQGMPGGYEDINVNVSWSRSAWQQGLVSKEFDFANGDLTTVTFKGCISFGGCPGFYLE